MKKQEFYGWNIVAILWILYFINMGFPLYGGSVINAEMLKEIPMDRAIYGFAYTLLNFFVGVPAFIVALSITKLGIRKTFVIGSGLIFMGALWMSFYASQPWHFVVGFGVIISTGIGFATIVCLSTTITRWFTRFRGRAMGIALSASGFAGLVGAPLMNLIMEKSNGNWRLAWIFVSIFAIVSGFIAYFFIKEKPEDIGQTPDGVEFDKELSSANSSIVTNQEWTPKEVYKTNSFWMIIIGACAVQFPFFFFTAHWILHLKGMGIESSIAAFAMGLFTMGGIGGRFIGGWLLDKISARFAFIIGLCFSLLGATFAMNLSKDTLLFSYITAILIGTGFGWGFTCMNTVTANFYGKKAYPKLNGTVLALSSLICCPAGVVAGKVFDIYNSYNPMYVFIIVLECIGIIAMLFAKMPQRKNEPLICERISE